MFSYFVTTGLSGAADLNRDHSVGLDELHRYVAANTAAWVRDATGGAETQSPVLLWGGGPKFKAKDCPVLLPSVMSAAKAIASADTPSRSSGFKLPESAGYASPYVQQARAEYAPELNRASQDATKKVPGSKTAKTTMRTRKKVKKRAERAAIRNEDRAREARNAPSVLTSPQMRQRTKPHRHPATSHRQPPTQNPTRAPRRTRNPPTAKSLPPTSRRKATQPPPAPIRKHPPPTPRNPATKESCPQSPMPKPPIS